MENSIMRGELKKKMSRKKFFASSGVAIVTGGLMAQNSLGSDVAIGSAAMGAEGACVSASFTGTLDESGNLVFPHGLGALLPANILSISAFIRLPDGKMRNISVQHVDETSIAVAGGVANASVKVGVVYSKG